MYTLLEQHNAPICHQLHYLQMASEKVAKAYRFRDTSTSPEKLLCEHVGLTRPANPEYPWQHGAVVLVPRDHEFPNLSLLTVDRGRTFLKLLKIAIKEFSTIAI